MAGRGRGRGGARGAPRGQPQSLYGRGGGGRGGGPGVRGAAPGAFTPTPSATSGLPEVSEHIMTTGVKRKGFGTSGTAVRVFTNHFEVKIPTDMIHHYDVMTPSEQTLPQRLTMEIIRHLQEVDAPQVFTPRAAYDGRKNMFAIRELPFTEGSQTFDVALTDPSQPVVQAGKSGPKPYKVKLTKVATINPEVLARYLEGKQSHDNEVLTAITALNVVVRMQPTLSYPFNVRSFFTDREKKDIGNGVILWRGYFQSVRPAMGKMLINIDISTGAMYKPGSLLDLCLDFFGKGTNARLLAPNAGFPERERLRLERFVSSLRIITTGANAPRGRTPRSIRKLSSAGANALSFTLREGGTMTVAQYFQRTYNRPLRHPDVICAVVGNGALIPLEMCEVLPGQIMRKQVPSDKVKSVLEFATRKPQERLGSIRNGLGVLAYGQSEYVRQFGLHVMDQQGPLSINARVLQPPTLKYGGEGRGSTIVPSDGQWNMIDRKFYKPARIERWCVVIYERKQRFGEDKASFLVSEMIKACDSVGMLVGEKEPIVFWHEAQGRVTEQLVSSGKQVEAKHGKGNFPKLIVAILPENATDLYVAIKHFGDVVAGVATQCLKASKCNNAKRQYFANVCLKMNVKLGGINTIPDPRSVAILTDPHNPTIVMGADVIHPAAHAEGRPSFAALVANVDSDTAKYIADCRVQESRQEMIQDLQAMAKSMLQMYMQYRGNIEKKANVQPKRIIFYRDGVSEGQFKQVLDFELTKVQAACAELNIKPAITVIVVGKRHHVRFFPTDPSQADKSGNCRAGTVVDREVTHPIELDFYLQSHAGLLGTSRPAHYNVLHDDNGFSADALQALSFALCHVYARSTRSVSIPAPVYYADIVCSRAKNHYTPGNNLDFDESNTMHGSAAADQLEKYKSQFKPLHENMKRLMYFS